MRPDAIRARVAGGARLRLRAAAGLAAACCGLALAQPVFVPPGREPTGFTWAELALLPDYCKDVQGVLWGDASNPSPRAAYWVSVMGNDFWYSHHYCRALAYVRRATAPGLSPSNRLAMRLRAADDYGFMIANGSPASPLMPEILLRMGELQLELDNLPEAQQAFERSRRIKPDYWPAYTRWIDVLMGVRLYDQAIALAHEGLKNVPDHPELRQRLAAAEEKQRQARTGAAHKATASVARAASQSP